MITKIGCSVIKEEDKIEFANPVDVTVIDEGQSAAPHISAMEDEGKV